MIFFINTQQSLQNAVNGNIVNHGGRFSVNPHQQQFFGGLHDGSGGFVPPFPVCQEHFCWHTFTFLQLKNYDEMNLTENLKLSRLRGKTRAFCVLVSFSAHQEVFV